MRHAVFAAFALCAALSCGPALGVEPASATHAEQQMCLTWLSAATGLAFGTDRFDELNAAHDRLSAATYARPDLDPATATRESQEALDLFIALSKEEYATQDAAPAIREAYLTKIFDHAEACLPMVPPAA